MLVNAMSYVSKPMYLSPTFFRNVDVKTLFGENFDVSYLNDDAFGRLLDGLFQADVSNLFVELSLSCMKKLKQDEQCIHMDPLPFTFTGKNTVTIHLEKDNMKRPPRMNANRGFTV